MLDNPASFVPIILIVTLSAALQGITGFGFGMLSMALLPHFMTIKATTPLVALVGFVNVAAILWQVRRSVDFQKTFGLLLGVAVGVPVGVFFLAHFNNDLLKQILGILLIVVAGQGLLVRAAISQPISSVWGPLAGFIGGITGGAFNLGGAPIVIYIYRQNWSKETITAVLQSVFCISSVYRLILYASTGILSTELALRAVLLIPFVIFGGFLGVRCSQRVEVNRLRWIINLLILLLGVSLLIKASR